MNEKEIDYRELLKRYMKHVIFCEGMSMVHHINDPEDYGFTDEQVECLEAIEEEVENE